MAERNAKTKKRERKKLDPLGIVLRVLLVLAAVLFCVLAVISWPSVRDNGFYATFFGGGEEEGEVVRAKELDFVANQKNVFAAYRDGLAVLSPSGLTVIGPDGDAVLDTSKSFGNPALAVDGDRLLAYDAGGSNMLYIEKEKLISDAPSMLGIITASINSDGWRLIIGEQSGWKAVASVLRPNGEEAYTMQSAERYLTSGDIAPDSTRIALGGVRQSNAQIISSVYIYDLSSDEPIAFWETTDGVPTSVRFLDDARILVICEKAAVFIDGDTGEELGRCAFGSGELASAAVGKGYVALAITAEGSDAWVVTLSYTGAELARRALGGVLDLSAEGEFLGVLTSDSVLVYNSYLESIADGDATAGCRRILLADDRAAYVLSANSAMLYEY